MRKWLNSDNSKNSSTKRSEIFSKLSTGNKPRYRVSAVSSSRYGALYPSRDCTHCSLQVRAQNGLARPMQELRAKTQARDENQARIDAKIQAKEAAKLLEAERRAAENAEKEKAAAAADAAKEAGGDEGEDDEDDLFGENEEEDDEEAAVTSQPRQETHEPEQPEASSSLQLLRLLLIVVAGRCMGRRFR